ncbi:hypothetical protein BTA51_09385 [Hahella sp. CCB-MM4]|uniref:hypothetical protein n=1 Tax=Hahella sp. (strain CCB-MM4) TaxID=1926491 RepID=UPI000B9AF9CF|nr:hypothetical protein [Hahella sp. CCB-MM4]OZG73982.1 hypothetical protein BTA51_09385 [Hahella sp. CCB-MM4]
MITYHKLCHFTLEHDYYSAHPPRLLEIKPTPECQRLLRQSRAGLKFADNQLLLFCEVQKSPRGEQYLAPEILRSTQAFTFALYPAEVPLKEISEFPSQLPHNSILNLRNSSCDNQQMPSLPPPSGNNPWESRANWLPLQTTQFTWPIRNHSGSWVIREVNSGCDLPAETLSKTPQGIAINLSGYPPGEYRLYQDNLLQSSFYVDPALQWRPPLAVLTLQTGPLVASDGQFVTPHSGEIKEKQFVLTIPAKQTTWRYFVIKKYRSEHAFGKLTIDSTNDRYQFGAPQAVTIKKGLPASRFDSQTPIPLSSDGLAGLSLRSSTQGVLIDHLPSPAMTQLVVDQNQAFSDQYIYI